MAKKATGKSGSKARSRSAQKSTALVERRSDGKRRSDDSNMGESFVRLLQSPLVAELVAVAATAALASLAEQGFANGSGSRGKRAGKAVKEAGKAATAAIGRRLGNELDEIRKAAKAAKSGAKE